MLSEDEDEEEEEGSQKNKKKLVVTFKQYQRIGRQLIRHLQATEEEGEACNAEVKNV